MHNLLIDPLIRFDRSEGGRAEASLPQVYAALMADEVEAFPALRPHQRHAWHAFLVQLGAMAMHRANVDTPPDTAGEWENLIRGLTPEPDYPDDEPWRLVVDDITKPAFMQPPASSQEQAKDYKSDDRNPRRARHAGHVKEPRFKIGGRGPGERRRLGLCVGDLADDGGIRREVQLWDFSNAQRLRQPPCIQLDPVCPPWGSRQTRSGCPRGIQIGAARQIPHE